MPEAEDDVLQRICEEVEAEMTLWFSAPSPDAVTDYAKAVARRYAATVGAKRIERAFKDGYEDGAAGFIGDEDDAEDMAEAQQQAWDRYATTEAGPKTQEPRAG